MCSADRAIILLLAGDASSHIAKQTSSAIRARNHSIVAGDALIQASTGLAVGDSAKQLAIASIEHVAHRAILAHVVGVAGRAIRSLAETGTAVEDEAFWADALVVVIYTERRLAEAVGLAGLKSCKRVVSLAGYADIVRGARGAGLDVALNAS